MEIQRVEKDQLLQKERPNLFNYIVKNHPGKNIGIRLLEGRLPSFVGVSVNGEPEKTTYSLFQLEDEKEIGRLEVFTEAIDGDNVGLIYEDYKTGVKLEWINFGPCWKGRQDNHRDIPFP